VDPQVNVGYIALQFYSNQCESQVHCASLTVINPFFVFPGHVGQLSCVLRAYIWRPSVINMLCLQGVSPFSFPITPQFLTPLMSHDRPTPTSSNFQIILDNALKEYKERTKNDLLTHPLADRLEVCNSASSILNVLQEQVQELNQSQRRNEKWTRWLDPTVKVLHGFSVTLEEHVTLVCLSS
jgi:hypothetical protein